MRSMRVIDDRCNLDHLQQRRRRRRSAYWRKGDLNSREHVVCIIMCIIKIGLSILQTVSLGGLVRLGLKLRGLPSISGGLVSLGPRPLMTLGPLDQPEYCLRIDCHYLEEEASLSICGASLAIRDAHAPAGPPGLLGYELHQIKSNQIKPKRLSGIVPTSRASEIAPNCIHFLFLPRPREDHTKYPHRPSRSPECNAIMKYVWAIFQSAGMWGFSVCLSLTKVGLTLIVPHH